jgi:hypothetical protein
MKDAVLSVIRHVLTIGGTYLVSKGILDAGAVEQAIGAIVTLGAVGWGIWDKKGRADNGAQ